MEVSVLKEYPSFTSSLRKQLIGLCMSEKLGTEKKSIIMLREIIA